MVQSSEYESLLEKAFRLVPSRIGTGERFEVPVVDALQEGSKTIIRNFEFIAASLRRPVEHIVRYLQKELAVPSTLEGQRLILHGKFNDRVLNEKIKNFCNIFVLCKECKRPDTRIVVGEHHIKMLVCEACGARSPVRG